MAKALIEQVAEQQQITPQDPDARRPRRAEPVAFLLADLGITKTHSQPYTSSDNPSSESNFKTLKYRPEFPARFDDIDHARAHCRAFVDWYNHAHRHSGIGLMTPAAFHHGHAAQPHAAWIDVLDAAYQRHPERFVRKPPAPPELPTARWINKPKEVAATGPPSPKFHDERGNLFAVDRVGELLVGPVGPVVVAVVTQQLLDSSLGISMISARVRRRVGKLSVPVFAAGLHRRLRSGLGQPVRVGAVSALRHCDGTDAAGDDPEHALGHRGASGRTARRLGEGGGDPVRWARLGVAPGAGKDRLTRPTTPCERAGAERRLGCGVPRLGAGARTPFLLVSGLLFLVFALVDIWLLGQSSDCLEGRVAHC